MHKRTSSVDLLCELIDDGLAEGCYHGPFDLTELGEKICVQCGTPAAKLSTDVAESYVDFVQRHEARKTAQAIRNVARAKARNTQTTWRGWTPA